MGQDIPSYHKGVQMKIKYNESGKAFCPAMCPLEKEHIKTLKEKCTINKPCRWVKEEPCLKRVNNLIEVCKDCIPTKYP